MSRSMSHHDWARAQGLILAIRQRMLVARLHELHALTDEARRFLEVERDPVMAGLQLNLLLLPLDDHPELRQSVQVLASWLVQYESVAYRGEEPQTFAAVAS